MDRRNETRTKIENDMGKNRYTKLKYLTSLLRLIMPRDDYIELSGDIEETFHTKSKTSGYFRAIAWFWVHLFKSLPQLLLTKIQWSFVMFFNYLKITFRNFFKHKLFSFINVAGLAIGIAACMTIYLWVQDELNYDSFHSKSNRIFRVERDVNGENFSGRWPILSGPYGPTLANVYPEILSCARLWRMELSVKDHQNLMQRQYMFAADNSFLDIFDFPLEKGDRETALARPNTAVLTGKTAQKYFGTKDAVGKTLSIQWGDGSEDFEVTGILKDIPNNSHVHFDMLISLSSAPEEIMNRWMGNFLYTYVLLSRDASVSALEKKFPSFLNEYYSPVLNEFAGRNVELNFKMQLLPVTDIHLHPAAHWEIEPQGSIASVYIFASISILILLIACINFMNLSTARAGKRAKEVGMRKTLGAYRGQLWSQFLSESVLQSVIALILAILLILVIIPVFNSISGKEFTNAQVFSSKNMMIILAITLTAGFFAGLYPAFYLSSFSPVSIIKGHKSSGTGKSFFRRGLVFFQFIISITLIIGTVTVYKQLKFVQNRSLGFDKENVMIIPVRNVSLIGNIESFRSEILRDPGINFVATSSHLPGDQAFSDSD
ncbi:ABC transporter permease, partial [candidate division KSB1 bacterium]